MVTGISFILIFVFTFIYFMIGITEVIGSSRKRIVIAYIIFTIAHFLSLSSVIIFIGSILYMIIEPLPILVPIIIFSSIGAYSLKVCISLYNHKIKFFNKWNDEIKPTLIKNK